MPSFTDAQVRTLYFLVTDPEEPMINDMQREAIRVLGDMARQGNGEAQAALTRVARRPDLHPFLREITHEEMSLPVPHRAGNTSS